VLFNSYEFIGVYLPIVVALFFIMARLNHRLAAASLAVASVAFYGYWDVRYVPLLLGSVAFNYLFGVAISRNARNGASPATVRAWLACGIAGDLVLLGYFKYFNFLLGSAAAIAGADWNIVPIVLPLGISFFTFTQIAFLVDTSQGKAQEYNFVHYTLFVTYFPHLIAGPILHHKEMMPQFAKPEIYRISLENLAIGGTIFIIGLFKKLDLADGLAHVVARVFEAPAGTRFVAMEAWAAVLGYALQLYFDFSGYSDMAVGLSRLFGIKLPINFNSPYKAANIIEFWRCWHMTLSRFLRDYLYIPLGGNRHGSGRRYLNLMITMALGGLWHGAGWTYVIWGSLHGLYLVANHGWQHLGGGRILSRLLGRLWRPTACLLTFGCVCVAWVFFRAPDVEHALDILRGMTGINGVLSSAMHIGKRDTVEMLPLLAIVWLLPNAYEFMARVEPALTAGLQLRPRRLQWRPTVPMALAIGVMGFLCITLLRRVTPFLYFQF